MPDITTITELDDFSSVETEWNQLHSQIGYHPIFTSYAWTELLWRHFYLKNKVIIICLRQKGELLAVFPFLEEKLRVKAGIVLTALRPLMNEHTPELSFAIADGQEEIVFRGLSDYIQSRNHEIDVIQLDRVIPDLYTNSDFQSAFTNNKYRSQVSNWNGSYYIGIEGEFEEYFSHLTKNFRKNRKNINNRIRKSGDFAFEISKTVDLDQFESFLDIENTGWKAAEGGSILQSIPVTQFYRALANIVSVRGEYLLATARLDGNPIASIFGFATDGIFYFLKIGIDNNLDKEILRTTPGQVALFYLLEYLYNEAYVGFDFTGPFYDYEKKWTKTVKQKYDIRIFNMSSQKAKWVYRLIYLRDAIINVRK